MSEKKELLNPADYGYLGNEPMSEIKSRDFQELFMFVERLLEDETKVLFPEKYMYVDKETSKKVKATKNNKDKIVKVVDPEGTLSASPTVYRTEKGIGLLKLKNFLAEIHYKNVESGVAVHKDKLTPKKDESIAE